MEIKIRAELYEDGFPVLRANGMSTICVNEKQIHGNYTKNELDHMVIQTYFEARNVMLKEVIPDLPEYRGS